MILLRNLGLFFVLFVPASCATGVIADLFVGPRPSPRLAYEIFGYATRGLPLVLPSLLAVPVLHFAYRRWLRGLPSSRALWLAISVTPVVLLAVHLLVFGDRYWSLPLVLLFAIPGALYGAVFRHS